MRIQLNGEPHDLDGPLSVAALLERLQINPLLVAVELNLLVVRRAKYAETMIEEGAEVEIVAFVGGGTTQVRRVRRGQFRRRYTV